MRLFIVLTCLVLAGAFGQAVVQRIRTRGSHQIREVKLGEISDASWETVNEAARQFRVHGARVRAEVKRASIASRGLSSQGSGGP